MLVVAVIVVGFALVVVFLAALAWNTAPVRYNNVSYIELQRYFSSWADPLALRGDIFVGTPELPSLIQFRKQTYKSKPGVLMCRFRNTDAPRRFFEVVVRALEDNGMDFSMELTRKKKAPRAAVVALDVSDPLLPSAAAHLCNVTLSAMGHPKETGVTVYCAGPLRPDFDFSNKPVIPTTRSGHAVYSLGYLLGRAARILGGGRGF